MLAITTQIISYSLQVHFKQMSTLIVSVMQLISSGAPGVPSMTSVPPLLSSSL